MLKKINYFIQAVFIYLFFLIGRISGIKLSRKIFSLIFLYLGPLFKSKKIIGKDGKPAIVGKKLNQLNLNLNLRKKFKDDIYTNYQVN